MISSSDSSILVVVVVVVVVGRDVDCARRGACCINPFISGRSKLLNSNPYTYLSKATASGRSLPQTDIIIEA